MKTFLIFLIVTFAFTQADESWSGSGSMACYGDMTITMKGDGEGLLDCTPAWGSPSAPPQGIIADGEDGSHWVTVDDKGYGDCEGTLWYEYGDLGLGYCDRMITMDDGHQTKKFCGYCDCDGYMNIHCSMLSGCHGA